MKRISCTGFVLGMLLMSGCARPLEVLPLERPQSPIADAIVVLGNRPPVDENGKVRPELAHRLRHGIELYKRGYAHKLVMTGGPSDVGVEAEHMKNFALNAGVPAEDILTEGKSTTTIENARFTRRLLCGDGPGGKGCQNHVIVVSNPYHAKRGARLFRCAGFEVTPMPAPLSERRRENRRHENGVHFIYAFMNECSQAGSD